MKGKYGISVMGLIAATSFVVVVHAAESITITVPANSSTITAMPMTITGTSSLPTTTVRLTINTTVIGSAVTDGLGDWSFPNVTLSNGSYTVTADLLSSSFEVLATMTNSFTVSDQHFVTIDSPLANAFVMLNPAKVEGYTSQPGGTIRVLLDTILQGTTIADSNGYWTFNLPLTVNGNHTLRAELQGSSAFKEIVFTGSVPVVYPTAISQMRIIEGRLPVSGSGSGSGYTYSVSGSIITVTFTPVFATIPIVVATGQRASGASTITVSAVSTNSTSITFSTGTTNVGFVASALAS